RARRCAPPPASRRDGPVAFEDERKRADRRQLRARVGRQKSSAPTFHGHLPSNRFAKERPRSRGTRVLTFTSNAVSTSATNPSLGGCEPKRLRRDLSPSTHRSTPTQPLAFRRLPSSQRSPRQ